MARQTKRRKRGEAHPRTHVSDGAGNFGDVKLLGDSVSEARIDYGPGYRVYFTRRGNTVVILLCGGDKTTQTADIKLAKRLAKEV
jgi:putative addiction module killer protein